MAYYSFSKPFTIALDAGHGGVDVGAVGVRNEVEITEETIAQLKALLDEDGRFRVVVSRKAGEEKSVTERNKKFQKVKPDLVLSVHANASEDASAYGFECYPSPPGFENHEVSMAFATLLAQEMDGAGARLRGDTGVRFGYYIENASGSSEKYLVDSTDLKVYDYDTFGMLKNMNCPAVLLEQCFVTNEADVADFGTDAGCKKAAQVYYQAICKYVDSLEADKAK